ncbi:hypothetical protein [Marinobacter sp. SS5-14b]|uniref:hypothetical protein n=1 Tax=Marinobacter sp. SS5-14b TaxID=3050456 RepID=UPI0026E004BD|nr:hypothetical protein [Marinobacter sp. SS5-14b]
MYRELAVMERTPILFGAFSSVVAVVHLRAFMMRGAIVLVMMVQPLRLQAVLAVMVVFRSLTG